MEQLFYSWKYIPIGVTANYHFKVSEPKFDPFLGAGLGYQVITCDYAPVSGVRILLEQRDLLHRPRGRALLPPAEHGRLRRRRRRCATFNIGLMFKLN